MLRCLAFILLLSSTAMADTIRVGTTGDYQPVTWWNTETEKFEGTDIDLAKAFARAHGHELIFVRTSWPSLMDALASGKFTMAVGGISYTDKRAKAALTSGTVRTDGKVALVRCGEETRFDRLEKIDRDGVRVIENPGGTNEKFARATIQHASLRILEDNHAPFRALKAHEADVMFTDGAEAVYKESLKEGLCAVNPESPYTHIRKVFLFAKDATALRDELNDWLAGRPKP